MKMTKRSPGSLIWTSPPLTITSVKQSAAPDRGRQEWLGEFTRTALSRGKKLQWPDTGYAAAFLARVIHWPTSTPHQPGLHTASAPLPSGRTSECFLVPAVRKTHTHTKKKSNGRSVARGKFTKQCQWGCWEKGLELSMLLFHIYLCPKIPVSSIPQRTIRLHSL